MFEKIKKYGPNLQGYLLLIFIGYWCYSSWTLWPLVGLIVFIAVLTPICIKLHKWNEAENEKMCADFPHDPYIQAKYGKKKAKA